MRRLLAIQSLIVSTLIVLVFSIPLAVVLRSLTEERAITFGRSDARALAPIISLAGDPRVTGAIVAVADRARPREVSVVFPDGSVLGAGQVIDDDRIGDPAAIAQARATGPLDRAVPGGRVVYEPVTRTNGTVVVIRVFIPTALLRRGVLQAWLGLGGLGVLLVAVSLLVADRLGRRMVRSVSHLSDAANALGRGDLSARVSPTGPPEVREVGSALNQLADRIDELLHTERAAIADLSHRLRTPVTALRAEAATGDVRRIEHGLEELTRTIDQIVRDAQAPVRRGIGIVSDLGEIVTARAAFWGVLAEDQARPFSVSIAPGPHPVAVVASDLGAAVDALIDNVFSHTAEGTAFSVEVRTGDGETVVLEVADQGRGIPTGFDVVRGRSSRGSTGVGLDMVRRLVEAAAGRVELRVAPAGGTVVQLTLPRAGASAPV